jgi:hypothetical protein
VEIETHKKALLGLGLWCGGARAAENGHTTAVLGAALVARDAVAGSLGAVACGAARLWRCGGAGLRSASTRAWRLGAAAEESSSAGVDGTARL